MTPTASSVAKLCFIFCPIFGFSQSQPDIEIQKIIPPTPNAASLGNYGNIPVGLYTGQPNISFPLYTIQYNDLNVPLTLSYAYSGLKVEEYPSWVGTGWTLSGAGVISRQVRGLADETTAGYNGSEQNGLKVVDFIVNGHYSSSQTQFLNGIVGGYKDAEPDMFVLSMPGYSAKFFFDETQCNATIKQAVVVPHQKLRIFGYFDYAGIYNIRPGVIEKFLVIDEKGVQYTFGVTEKAAGVEPGDPDENDFANSWYLSQIQTPSGNQITYEYTDRILDMPGTLFEKRSIPLSIPGQYPFQPSVSHTVRYNHTSTNEKILRRISFRTGLIEFIEGAERSDWNSTIWSPLNKATEQPKPLAKVIISRESKIVKEIDFAYSYFGGDARLRLDGFQEKNGTTSNPPYQFFYSDGQFPPIGEIATLFHQDHWGYYMGSTLHGDPITTLLPPYSEAFEQPNGTMFVVNVPGNLRTPNHNASSAGMLETIKYPTGGNTEFEYEPNDYWGSSAEKFNMCAGDFAFLNKASISFTWGDLSEAKQFTVISPTCMKFNYSLSVPCIDGEAGVKIEQQGGSIVMHHIASNKMWGMDYSDFGPGANELFSLQPGTYFLTAWGINENACGLPTEATITLNQVEQTQSGEGNFKAGGMRLKKIKDCDNTQECVVKYYIYKDLQDPQKSSGVLINPPVYQYYQLVRFSEQNPGMPTTYYDINHTMLTAHSEVPIASTLGSTIGYKSVVVTEEVNGTKGKTEYSFTSATEYPDGGISTYPFPPRLSNDWKRGTKLFEGIYGYQPPDQQVVISQTTSTPCITSTFNRTIGIKPRKHFDNQSSIPSSILDYDFVGYSLGSGWSAICNEDQVEYSYLNGVQQALNKPKSLYYDNVHLKVIRIESTNSKGQQLETTFKYIEDVGDVSGLTPTEITGITAHPDKTAVVEQQSFVDGQLQSTKRNIYNGIDLVKVQSATGNNALEDYVTYNEYDNWGNVVNYTTRMGDNKSYLWTSDGMYPLAEASNAAPTDIFFTSFESGGVLFTDANGNNLALSGMRVLTSGSYVFPASFNPSDPPNILMSYWYWENNKWNFSGEIPYNATITTSGTKLDEIRAFPIGAQMTTLNHDPGFGVTGVTDPNNQSMHYEYDLLGRLILIRDHDGNILKEYKYHYNGQN